MKQILTSMIIATSLLGATQASALSCLRPDSARTFQFASDAEENYVVLMGTFDFDVPQRPRSNTINNPQTVVVPARFDGMFLGATGFKSEAEFDLTIAFTCAGSWCGSIPPNAGELLAFVEQTEDGFFLEVDACGSNTFSDPRNGPMQQVESCMRGEGCEEAAMR